MAPRSPLRDRWRIVGTWTAVLLPLAVAAAVFFGHRQTVEWQWRHNERQVREALEANDGRDITGPITFFENATGVTSMAGTNGTGTRTAVPSLDGEMREWEAWYTAHKACLSWDIAEQRLELRKGCDP